MPNWNTVLEEIEGIECKARASLDQVRRKYLKELHQKTGRNIIAYYSGWLQKPVYEEVIVNENDKNGFMATIHQLDRSIGLDLLLHTPGGSTAATESIVDYLHKMFDGNIRAFVPQVAMSAGTMMACACKEIVMGKQTNLGPIDPQFRGIPASGVIEEFETAKREIKKDPSCIPLWQAIVGKYHPAFIGDCDKAIKWSREIVTNWLKTVMFDGEPDAEEKAKAIVKHLSDHSHHKSHDRHIHIEECLKIGLKVTALEAMGDEVQDLVLTVHHAYMHTFARSATAIKIMENQNGVAVVNHVRPRNN